MTTITIHIPWLLLIPMVILLLYGVFEAVRRIGRFYFIYSNILTAEKRDSRSFGYLSEADRKAQELIEAKTKETWRKFELSNWLDVQKVWDDSFRHIHNIAAVYHPESNKPEFEITVIELLRLNERINRRIIAILEPLTMLQQLSVNSLIETHTLINQANETIEKKGLKKGAGIASRIWQAVNAINPEYWIRRVLLQTASEVVYRKAMTSIYRIIGNEAIQVYRSSSAKPIVLEAMMEEEGKAREDNQQPTQAIEPEIIIETERKRHDREFFAEQTQSRYNENLYTRITKLVAQFFEGSLTLWKKLASPEPIIQYYQKQGHGIYTLQDIHTLPLDNVQIVTRRYRKSGEWLCAIEGAATGVGGFTMIAVDAVSLIALQLRTLQQIGFCYGFDMTQPEEKMFAVKLLVESYKHPSRKDRNAILTQMKWVSQLINGTSPLHVLQKQMFSNGIGKAVQIIGTKLGARKAAQLVPFIGAAVGGYLNKKVMKEIAEIADEVYRERFLSRQKVIAYNDAVVREEPSIK